MTRRSQIYARLNHARSQLAELRRQERNFLARKPYSLSVRYNRSTREHALWFHVRARPSIAFSLLMAEFVHQVRASLDNMAWQMAAKHLGAEPKGKTLTAFPVCLAIDDWDRRATKAKIRDFPPAAIPIVKSLQPFQDGDMARYHHLWLLDGLWNADKHRTLHLTLGSASKLRITFNKPVDIHWINLRGFDKDAPTCRVYARGETELRYRLKPPYRIGFGDGGPYQSGIIVVNNLSRLYRFTRYEVLPQLRPFL